MTSISSMTGYASVDGSLDDKRWTWEVKSVNGRGLEPRFKLPMGYDVLEVPLRKILATRLKRGSVNINLLLKGVKSGTRIDLNTDILEQVIGHIAHLNCRLDCEKPRAENILNIKGVLDFSDPGSENQDILHSQLTESFSQAIDRLDEARIEEGRVLCQIIHAQIDEIEVLTHSAQKHESATLQAIKARVERQINDVTSIEGFDPERLEQEVSVLAIKADIREEIDRLFAHVEAARKLLSSGRGVGRQLDFLSQEFNREANTLCSKVQSMPLKTIGLKMKSVIDQMREQIQNVE